MDKKENGVEKVQSIVLITIVKAVRKSIYRMAY